MADVDQGTGPGSTGAAAGDEADKSSISFVIGGVVLSLVVLGASEAAIRAAGWATPVSHVLAIASACALAASTLLIANKGRLTSLPWWMYAAAAAAVGAIILVAAITTDGGAGHTFTGELTADKHSERRTVSTHPGERLLVVLETHGGLEAELELTRGVIDLSGTPTSGGHLMIDETLPGGTWVVTVRALNDSTGDYDLRINSDSAREIAVGDVIDSDELNDPSDSNGYSFELGERQKVYIAVRPIDPPELTLTVRVLKANGFAAANPRPVDNGWEICQSLDRGSYILAVRSSDGTTGSYALTVSTQAPSGTPTATTTPPSERVTVPSVVGQSQADAETALFDAGFAPRSIPICSASVPRDTVRQVVRIENSDEIQVVGLDGVVDDENELPAGTELLVKVGTGEPCN